LEGEVVGLLRYLATSRADFPAVGDWVAISEFDENKVLIHAVLPRNTLIERQSVGKAGENQIIATNVDYALIVQAVDRDFNRNRIERYLILCNASKVEPIVILNKIDQITALQLEEMLVQVRQRIKDIPIIAISNETKVGYPELLKLIKRGKTYCLLGSSGVGKSTLMNTISGRYLMKTNTISLSTSKGRHVTSHRELVVLEHGGILIDNPGMREVGIADEADGLEITFDTIVKLAQKCKFLNCTHIHEKGCAVLEALENNEIERETYQNYLKLEREKEHYASTKLERRKKDKAFGKMVKDHKKNRKLSKY
jgi:ribosome biogenesis GTPase